MAERDTGFSSIFHILPFDQVEEFVFNRLDVKSKKNCRLVCKRWEERVSEAVYFNPKLVDEETAQMFKKMTKPIKDLTLSFLNFPYPINGYGFNSVQKLILKGTYGLDGKMCSENLHRLLKECEDIQSLEVVDVVVPDGTDLSFLHNILFSNLLRLKISSEVSDFCAELLRRTFPQLTSLSIMFFFTHIERDGSPCMDLYYTQIFEFIGRHAKTLKDIDIYRGDIIEAAEIGIEVQLCELDTDAKKTLIQQLKQVQLSTFEYAGTHADEVYPLGYEMFKAQTQLTHIEIKRGQMEFWNLLPQVLEQCSHTLTYLSLEGYINIAVGDDEFFSCSLLANCSKLEILRLELDDGVRLTEIQYLPKHIKELRLVFRDDDLRLTASQVEFIAREMNNLEDLDINSCDLITLSLFKKLMKMPLLTTLNLPYESCGLNEIRTWILQFGSGGIRIRHLSDDSLLINVDRLKFIWGVI